MYIRNYFLKQPRRGKTREALITPYKRSAVWDLAPETSSDCGDSDTGARSAIRVCLSLIIVVLLALASPLSAQHRDTLYVVEEEPVYDTLFVHDTLRVHDTVALAMDEYRQSPVHHARQNGLDLKHEIEVSYGLAPYIGTFYRGSFENVSVEDYSSLKELFFGGVNLQYHLYFNKLHSVDFNLTWAAMKHTAPTIYVRHWAYRNDYVHYLCFQAGYSIHFFNTEKISLYSSVSFGATLYLIGDAAYYEDGINHLPEVPNVYPLKNCHDWRFDFNINYLGIRIGNHNAANIELGLGTQGMLKIGYSYKF